MPTSSICWSFSIEWACYAPTAAPRSRRYIEFLRSQFPEAQELKREESRIIVP